LNSLASDAWRSEVVIEADRLDTELARSPPANLTNPAVARIQEAVASARSFAEEPTTFSSWRSGSRIERAWAALWAAKEDLTDVASDARLMAELDFVKAKAATFSPPYTTPLTYDTAGTPTPAREAIRQVWLLYHIAESAGHRRSRQFRNYLWIGVAVLTVAAIGCAIFIGSDRRLVGIGALAGSLTAISAVITGTKVSGSYPVALAQSIIKVPAGAVAAILGVLLLRAGLPGLPGIKSSAEDAWAVIFGTSQYLMTRLVDKATIGGS
jgi:hypothetical protein